MAEKKEEVAVEVGSKGKELGMNKKDEDKHGLPMQGVIFHNIGSLHGEDPSNSTLESAHSNQASIR